MPSVASRPASPWSRRSPTPSGLPHLDGAVACFDCRLQDSLPAGDHRLLIGAVERFAASGGEPLLFVQGSFRTL
jgi:flavin reductase (DIM6/NTAB) family NADH-FMN oxidoreductase RutF